MNYRHWQLCSIAVCMAFVATTALGQMQGQPVPLTGLAQAPQVKENFKVVIQKGTNSATGNDFEFFYLFCKVKDILDNVYLNQIVREKKISATTKAPKSFSGGFSKLVEGSTLSRLIGSSPATPVNETELIRLLVSKNWRALSAKRQGKATPEDEKQIFVLDPAIKRYVPEKCVPLSAGMVGTIIGRVVFTVEEDATHLSELKATFKDERRCKKSRISKVAKARAATGSAYSRAKTGAKELGQKAKATASSAWDSTKKAASSAKTKVSSAASSAKASVTKRFGK